MKYPSEFKVEIGSVHHTVDQTLANASVLQTTGNFDVSNPRDSTFEAARSLAWVR